MKKLITTTIILTLCSFTYGQKTKDSSIIFIPKDSTEYISNQDINNVLSYYYGRIPEKDYNQMRLYYAELQGFAIKRKRIKK